jgi:hypothetical protein
VIRRFKREWTNFLNVYQPVAVTLAGLDRGMRTRALIELTGLHRFRGFSWESASLDQAAEKRGVHSCSDGHLGNVHVWP